MKLCYARNANVVTNRWICWSCRGKGIILIHKFYKSRCDRVIGNHVQAVYCLSTDRDHRFDSP